MFKKAIAETLVQVLSELGYESFITGSVSLGMDNSESDIDVAVFRVPAKNLNSHLIYEEGFKITGGEKYIGNADDQEVYVWKNAINMIVYRNHPKFINDRELHTKIRAKLESDPLLKKIIINLNKRGMSSPEIFQMLRDVL